MSKRDFNNKAKVGKSRMLVFNILPVNHVVLTK